MEELGYTVTRPAPNQIHIHGEFRNPEPIALEAMGIVEDHTGIAVWASNAQGKWTLVVWDRPDLVTITGARWRHQILKFMGPAAVAAALKLGGPGNLSDVVLPKHVPSDAARDVLARVGIDDPTPAIEDGDVV